MIWIFYKLGLKQGQYKSELEWQKNLPLFQRQTADRQRSTIKGQLAEKFAPFLPGFPFKPSECKFIGDPIDYLVFEGLDERDIKKIHLLEVKNNTSRLSKHQKQIKNILYETTKLKAPEKLDITRESKLAIIAHIPPIIITW